MGLYVPLNIANANNVFKDKNRNTKVLTTCAVLILVINCKIGVADVTQTFPRYVARIAVVGTS